MRSEGPDFLRPTFFIVGAPKSGTTALAEYLSTHPEVQISEPKEPKYFNTDFHDAHRYARTADEYARCFPRQPGRPTPKAVGEATVWYLYSREAVPNILQYEPDARFVLMIRNPVDLVQSLHAQLLYGGHEDLTSLADAWSAQEARARGEGVPGACTEPKVLQYGEVARLGTQLRRLLRHVARERVLVLLFDDLRQDSGALYQRVLEFLDVGLDGRSDFPVVNRSRQIILRPVARALHHGKALKNQLGLRGSLGIWRAVSPLITRPRPRPTPPPGLLAELREHFAPEVELLSRLLDRDLAHWTRPDSRDEAST